jgi:antitoxin component YwqK of YwqJK toxin-antitoxin module
VRKLIFLFNIIGIFYSYSQNTTNVKDGFVKYYHPNGKVSSEGYLKNGKPDGYWKNYYDNGIIKIEGNRKNFLLDSLWKFYDSKGRLQKTYNYKEGKKNGLCTYYDTLGRLVMTEEYVNDVREGIQKKYYPDGKIQSVVPFKKGKQDGTGYEYDTDGKIITVIQYQGGITLEVEKINRKDALGRKEGLWKEFDEEGNVIKEMFYNADSLNGFVKTYNRKGNLTSIKKYNNGKLLEKAPEIRNVEVVRNTYEDGTLEYEGVYDEGVPIGTHYHYKKVMRCDSMEYYNDSIGGYYKKLVCRPYPIPDSAVEYVNGKVVAKGPVDSLRNPTGLWTEYHVTGEFKARGMYANGKRIGEWKFYYPSGKIEQEGKYDKKGRAQGEWKWYHENGALLRKENYVNGKREGIMEEYFDNGQLFVKGEFFDDKKEGIWTYNDGKYYEVGKYVQGEPDSVWVSYFMPQKIKCFEIRFQNGVPEGKHTYYYPDGKKMVEGTYQGGMKQGDWKFYDEFGFQYLVIHYKDDIEIKWQGIKIIPTYEQSLRTYNIRIGEDKTQTIKSKP